MLHHNETCALLLLSMLILGGCTPDNESFALPPLLAFLLTIIAWMIRFLVIPSILGGMVWLGWHIVQLPAHSEDQKISKTYAFWLGWVIFVLIVTLSLFSRFFTPEHSINAFGRVWFYVAIGFVAGFAIVAAVHSFLEIRAISALVLILTSSGSIALYFYIFVNTLRDAILLLAVSSLGGALAYVVFFPNVVISLRGR